MGRYGITNGKRYEKLWGEALLASWPTPDASGAQDGEAFETWEKRRLDTKARVGNGNGFGTPLTIAAQLASWPTPRTVTGGAESAKRKQELGRNNHRDGTRLRKDNNLGVGTHGVSLHHLVQLAATGTPPTGSPASTEKRGQLNPAHSRWLMGLPVEWDACAPTETASSLRRRKSS